MLRKTRIAALAMAMCLLVTTTALADDGVKISVTRSVPSPAVGESFTVSAAISGNPGFSAVQFTLAFDPAVLKCTAAATGLVLRDALSAVNPDAPDGAIVAAAAISPVTENGTLATFTFQVIAAGDISVRFTHYALLDADGGSIPFTLTQADNGTAAGGSASGGSSGGAGGTAAPSTDSGVSDVRLFSDTAAESYIGAAVEQGLFQGYSDGGFHPDASVTRGAFVTVVWRMAGSPAAAEAPPFGDTVHAWCEQAVAWAYESGLVGGKSATVFAPDSPVTRQEAMKILFLYSGGQSGQESLFTGIYDSTYADSASLSDWARAPMYWGIYNELLCGTSSTTLSPRGTATRAQLAKILVNYTARFGK